MFFFFIITYWTLVKAFSHYFLFMFYCLLLNIDKPHSPTYAVFILLSGSKSDDGVRDYSGVDWRQGRDYWQDDSVLHTVVAWKIRGKIFKIVYIYIQLLNFTVRCDIIKSVNLTAQGCSLKKRWDLPMLNRKHRRLELPRPTRSSVQSTRSPRVFEKFCDETFIYLFIYYCYYL